MSTECCFVLSAAWLIGAWWIGDAIRTAIPRVIDFKHSGSTTVRYEKGDKP